ncbi:Protein of unknown function [Sulfitobacter brevis]|uniref:Glycosyltransferase 61 catalytic domain-containing protein n=1 Tax=Sulfitobacter brevis TaxID=74348 RepID=A0A1I1Y850_9RHOB|nr:glycosyltransferase family 61 protein [Sulfitobacter brevis]SFE15744.1 Protein of unknown function [Sulfitobacter brevis]
MLNWQKRQPKVLLTVRNKIDFSLPPDELFLNPWRDGGLWTLQKPTFIWQPLAHTTIEGFAASAHAPITAMINTQIALMKKHRQFKSAVIYNCVPVLVQAAGFRKSYITSHDKVLLSGAAGVRAINQHRWQSDEGETSVPAVKPQLADYFTQCQAGAPDSHIPVLDAGFLQGVDFAVACRNTFNYFHFITESLSQLTVLDGLDFQGEIYFHFPNNAEKQRPFAESFVEALFPEFSGRVHFERAPKDYPFVLTAFDLAGAHFQQPMQSDPFAALALSNRVWAGTQATAAAQSQLAMNTVSSALLLLRQRALDALEGGDFSHLPTRFYVGRDDRQSRERHMQGEDLLFDHLRLFGFEYVVFENLSPLEQIAIMANAEAMVSYHGAGFTNMLFASSEAYVIEIGTLQTAQFRWGDFWPLANAAGCKYISFFADFNTDNPLSEPNFAVDGIVPVALGEAGIGQVMAFIVTVLGQFPTLAQSTDLKKLARATYTAGAFDQTEKLLAGHAEMVARDAELCLLKADCCKQLDLPKAELVALDQAFKADPKRWQTLVRMIWCANRCERPQVIRWALSRLLADFPDRHDRFVSAHEWVRYVT